MRKTIGNRRAEKIRKINDDIPLVNYVDKINRGEIADYETEDVDMKKLEENRECKIELDHTKFQFKQLKKNNHLTWYGKYLYKTWLLSSQLEN